MDMVYYRRNRLGEFLSAIEKRHSNPEWASELKDWFDKQFWTVGKNYALAGIIFRDRSEVLVEWEDSHITAGVYSEKLRQKVRACLEFVPVDAGVKFLGECDDVVKAEMRLRQMQTLGWWNYIKNRKLRNELKKIRNREFSLAELAAAVCCFYVETGLGGIDQAKKFFGFG